MPNPYILFPDSYGATQGNLTPYQQNIATQNQSIQQLLQQGNQLANTALGASNSPGQIDPQKLASGLRNMGQTLNAYSPWEQNRVATQYGLDPYSESSRMVAMQERGM